MKKVLTILLFASLVVACKKITPNNVEKTMTEGTWKVTLFSEDGVNETFHFSGYSFVFNENSQVTAENGSITMNGTWSVSNDSSDDDSSSDIDFNLSFDALNNFDELTDDWDIISRTDSKIELEDTSGDGSIDKLTFEKI